MLPVASHVTVIRPDHLGHPGWNWFATSLATVGNVMDSPAEPYVNIVRSCLEYGINRQRVTVAYTPGATSATLTWVSGTHDFAVGEYVNFKGYGGVNTASNGFYKVTAAPDNTHATITVPITFSVNVLGTEVTHDLLFDRVFCHWDGQGTADHDPAIGLKRAEAWTVAGTSMITSGMKYGTSCVSFTTSLDSVNTFSTALSNAMFNFTVDGWVYPTSTSTLRTIAAFGVSGILGITTANNIFWRENGTTRITANTALTLNTWSHVAVTRHRGLVTLYVNGVKQTTTYASSHWATADDRTFYIGGGSTANTNFPGYIQNIRLTQGVARWSATFTVPDYLPTPSPGIGYFVVRGGGSLQSSVTPNFGRRSANGMLPHSLWYGRIPKLEAEYGADSSPHIGVTAASYSGGSNYSYLAMYTNGGPSGGYMHRLSTDGTTVRSEVDISFIMSDIGFYTVMRRVSTLSHVRVCMTYFGLGVSRRPDTYGTGLEELHRNFIVVQPSNGNTFHQYATSPQTDADDRASIITNGTEGIFTTPYVGNLGVTYAPYDTSDVLGLGFSGGSVPTIMGVTSLSDPVQQIGASTAFGNMAPNWSTASVRAMCPLWITPTMFISERTVLTLPGLRLGLSGSAVTTNACIFPYNHPSRVSYMDGTIERPAAMVDAVHSRALIDLEPTEWSIL